MKWVPGTIDLLHCARCGVAPNPVCFNCFMGRPFVWDRACPGCKTERPIVRQYLDGWRCDTCRGPDWRPPAGGVLAKPDPGGSS
jgi:hypothetical protein